MRIYAAAVVSLLLLHGSLLAVGGWLMSPGKTEIGHMGAAFYFSKTLRFDVFRVNPPLTRMVAALAVWMCNPHGDLNDYSSRPQDRCEWTIGYSFMRANTPEALRWCFATARWSLIPVILLGAYSGARLSDEIYGKPAGLVFLVVLSLCPLGLGWGATICPDACSAALGMAALRALRLWLLARTWTRAAVAGACLGSLPLAKLTWVIAFGIWPFVWCVWALAAGAPLRRFAAQLGMLLLVAFYTLNAGYCFDGTCRPLREYVFVSRALNGRVQRTTHVPSLGNRFADAALGNIRVPLPADFLRGIDMQRYEFERGSPSYLRGVWSDDGWWYYYLYVLLLKTPAATLGLGAMALALAALRRGYTARARDETLVLAPCIAILFLVSSQTGLSGHPRYILPALPLAFVAISRVGRAFATKNIVGAVSVLVFCVWLALGSLSVHPHSMSYFNELAAIVSTPDAQWHAAPAEICASWAPLGRTVARWLTAGPRNGPRHLLGSNIDAGQELFYLETWHRMHSEARPMDVAYFGDYPLTHTGLRHAQHPPYAPDGVDRREHDADPSTFAPPPGWYALSVNEVLGRRRQYDYFLRFEPAAAIGYSIYIYHVHAAGSRAVFQPP